MLRNLVLTLLAAAALSLPAAGRATAAPRPNVVLIMVDDLGWPDVSSYGLDRVPTPNLDRIAGRGAAFSNAYVPAPVCAVSRAGLLTGRSPQRYGFEYNLDDQNNLDDGLPLSERTLADRLLAAGYRTAAVGKWHLGYAPNFYPTRRGFQEFYGFLSGETPYVDPATFGIVTTRTKADRPIGPRKPHQQVVEGPDARVVDNFDRYLTDELTARAVSYVERQAGGPDPFFLYLAYSAPHWPLQVPQAWYDRFAHIEDPVRRTYVAMIAAMDAGVGQVLDALERKGAAEDTLVIFLSDNGCPIQFGFCDCAHPLASGKFTHLEGGVRVPFLMAWPRGLKPRGVVDAPVSSLDVVPTVMKAAGLRTRGEGLDGQDLVVAANGKAPPRRQLFFRQSPVSAMREGRWKLWRSREPRRARLFDLERDPGETMDLAATHPARVKSLSEALDRWESSLAPPEWPVRRVDEVRICRVTTQRVY